MTIKGLIGKITPRFVLASYHYLLALLGAMIFCFPSRSLTVIGVTGTSGKSTTVDLISRILEEAGYKVASTSTARFKIGEKEWENKYKMTMPGRFVVQKFLSQAKKEGAKYVVLEVTSEGIRQFRNKFINFKTAVFTNLTPEHIESHGGFENYRNEKIKLFKVAKNTHIINIDDKNAKYFLDIPAQNIFSFAVKNSSAKIKAENIKTENGLSFEVGGIEFTLNLLGYFNVYNSLAAIAVAKSEGVDLGICKKALEKAKGIAGRMEVVTSSPFEVIVDYAHTPEQLENVYKTFKNKKLICVLGSCGGGRDKWKRPVLGEIAKKYCDRVIVTNEDPYDEDPLEIIDQVAKTAGGNVKKIIDRKEAIRTAVNTAQINDVVIITGKGSEPWLCIKDGKKIPWSDSKIAKEFLSEK